MMKDRLKEKINNFLCSTNVSATATKFILAALAVGVVIFIGAVAPNIFQCLGKYKRRQNYSKKQIKDALYSLKRRRLIKIIRYKNNRIKVELTNKGARRIKEFIFNDLAISKPKKWDKKWYIVIFDIPIKFNRAREALRSKIKALGFYQLQKSVWIYPYPCEDEILLISKIFNVEEFIEILVVEKLLHEDALRKFFNL